MDNDYTDILIELNKAVKALKFYPEGHPKRATIINDLYTALKGRADETGDIELKANNKGIFSDGKPISASSPAVQMLTRLLFVRKVQALTITSAIRPEDALTLLLTLNLEPEDIYSKGGVEKILARNGVEGILMNEITYEELQELKKEVEEEEDEEEGEAEEEQEEQEQAPQEPLSELLSRIDTERDMLRYNDLAIRIKERTDLLISQKNFDEAFPVLALFLKHTDPAHVEQQGLRETAHETVLRYLTKDILNHLVSTLGGKDESNAAVAAALIKMAGEEAIEPLLDTLVKTEDANIRRAVFDAIVKIGEPVRESVETRIHKGEWFEVRQMAALLGALGGGQSIATLEKIYYESPDPHVKKEMLKSLAVIPSEVSIQILISALDEEDEGIVGQAIISLGILSVDSVIETLGAMISKKGRFYENFEMKKVVIKGLGFMKDELTIPYLTTILFKKTWFGKDLNDELRKEAVTSLGKIGTDEAFEAIEKVYEESTGALYTTCKRTLEGRK